MAFRAAVDTCLAVSATMPATFDEAGYTALTYTQVGEITDMGEWGGEFELVEHQDICTGIVQKAKGSNNQGSQEIELAIDPADAGQMIVKDFHEGSRQYDSVVVRINDPWGTRWYFTAKVMSFTKSATGPDEVYSGSLTLEIDRQIVEVDAP